MPRLWSGAVRTVVLTVSTSVARREADDDSGPLLARLAEEAGADVVAMEVVPDDFALIEDRLHHYVDDGVRVHLHHGRHRPHPRRRHARGDAGGDRARRARDRRGDARREPRATRRWASCRAASRASRGETLIVNFPGSPKAIEQLFGLLAPVLEHAARSMVRDGGRAASH